MVISIAIIFLLLVASFIIVLTSFTALEDKVQLVYYHLHLAKFPSAAIISSYYGLTVASPYVGMDRKQDGSSNQCISIFMAISSLGTSANV